MMTMTSNPGLLWHDVLWIGALAAAPVAMLIALMCRGVARPATRHVLWCLALLTFVVPGTLIATGWTGAIGRVLLGVPRALAWAWPPERAADGLAEEQPRAVEPLTAQSDGLDEVPVAQAGVERGSTVEYEWIDAPMPATEGLGSGLTSALPTAPGTGDAGISALRSESALSMVDQGSRAAWATRSEWRGQAAGGRRAASDHAAPGPSAPIARRASATATPANQLSEPSEATAPDIDERTSDLEAVRSHFAAVPAVIEARWPTVDSPTKVEPTSLFSPFREVAEPRKLVDRVVPGLADRMWAVLAQAVGLPVSQTEGAKAEGVAAGSMSPTGSDLWAARDVDHAGQDADPAILDPVWNALASASGAMETWIGTVRRAAGSILEIPAPPATLWVAGVAVIVALGAARSLAGHAAIRRMQPVDRSDRRLVQDLSEKLGLRHAPRAFVVRTRISPMVCGGLNPKIILPDALWRTLDMDARRAVLTHELAHLRRRDQWVRLMELVVGVLYWWHPVLWAVRGRIRDEADLCCDAWVTTLFPGLRRSYAEALLRTRCYLSIPGATAPVAGLGMASARSRRFSRRLTMVMAGQTRPKTSPWGLALALAVGTAALVIVPSLADAALAKKTELCPPGATATSAATVAPVARTGGGTRVASTSAAPMPAGVMVYSGASPIAVAGGGEGGACCATGSEAVASSDPLSPTPSSMAAAEVLYTRAARGSSALSPAPSTSGGRYSAVSSGGGAFATTARSAGDSDLDARVRALEARIEALDASIQRLLMHFEGGASANPFGAGTPQAFQSFNSMPQFELASAGEGESEWVSYSLPDEKAQAVYELMRRDDVPIYVSLEEGAIKLEGTPAQQRVFAQFLALIHPDGAQDWLAGDAGEPGWRDHAVAGNAAARAELEATMVARMAQGQAARELQVARRAELEARAAQMGAQLRARQDEWRRQSELQREQGRRQTEEMRRSSERSAVRAEQVEERARQVQERAASALIVAEREALEAKAEALMAEAEALRETADELAAEADNMQAELDDAMAEMENELAEAEAEMADAMAEAEAQMQDDQDWAEIELDDEEAENCACGDNCEGDDCADDCDDDCHCHGETAVTTPTPPTPPHAAVPARPARPAAPARAARPAAAPRPIRD